MSLEVEQKLSLKETFERDGFLHVPSVVEVSECQRVRAFIEQKFNEPTEKRRNGDSEKFLFDCFSRYPDLWCLIFNARIVETLREVLGEKPTLVHESAAQNKNYSGWHKDTTAQEGSGLNFHKEPSFLMVQAAFYLQDNHPEYGGGLDVSVGSHKVADRYVKPVPKTKNPFKHLKRIFVPEKPTVSYGSNVDMENVYQIPGKVGDLVIFNVLTDHRATPRLVDGGKDKLGLIAAFSRNNEGLYKYHKFIRSRKDYIYLQEHAYSEAFQNEARIAGVALV